MQQVVKARLLCILSSLVEVGRLLICPQQNNLNLIQSHSELEIVFLNAPEDRFLFVFFPHLYFNALITNQRLLMKSKIHKHTSYKMD